MIPIDREIRRLVFLVALIIALAAGPAAFGQDDDVIDDAIAPIAPQAVMPVAGSLVRPSSIRSRSISGFSAGGVARLGARTRLDANLALRIDDLDRACAVTELQKKKLKLAGLGDIKRYYDRVEDLKRKYSTRRGNAAQYQQQHLAGNAAAAARAE